MLSSIRDRYRIQITFFIATMLVFILFISAFAFVYAESSKRVKEQEIALFQETVNRGAEKMETLFTNYWWKKIPDMEDSSALAALAGRSGALRNRDYASLLKLKAYLEQNLDDTGIETYFLLLFDDDESFACSPGFIIHSFVQSYQNGEFAIQGMPYDDFTALIRQSANHGALVNDANVVHLQINMDHSTADGDCLLYVRRLSVMNSSVEIYALWMIGVRELYQTLTDRTGDDWGIVLQSGEQTLFSNMACSVPMAQDHVYNPQMKSTYFRVNINIMNLSCYLALPDAEIYDQISYFSLLLNILLGVFVVLTVTFSLLISRYYIQPIQRLYKKLTAEISHAKRHSIVSEVEKHVMEMDMERENLSKELSKWHVSLETNILGKLLSNVTIPSAEREMIERMSWYDENHRFYVLLITLYADANGNTPLSYLNVSAVVCRCFPEARVLAIGKNRLAVLLGENSMPFLAALEAPEAETLFNGLLQSLDRLWEAPCRYSIGASKSCETVWNVHLAFQEAELALLNAMMWKKPLVVYGGGTAISASQYRFAYGELEKLYNLLASGDGQKACELLDRVVERNFGSDSQNRSNPLIGMQFHYELTGMLIRLSTDKKVVEKLESILAYQPDVPFDLLIDSLKKVFLYISEVVSGDKADLNDTSAMLLQYIMDHYRNPDLSLGMLAEAFSMSERNLSRYFKSKLGQTFSEILEGLRLSEAEALLRQNKLPVKTIAEKVGYANTVTFYKAFKRKHGVATSDWMNRKTE